MLRRTHKHRDRLLLWFLLSALSLVLQVLGERNLCESYNSVTSLPVQLHSPGFPGAIPVGPTQCSCSFRLLDPAQTGNVIKILVNKFIVGSYVSINVTSGSGEVLWQRTAGDAPAVLQLGKDAVLAEGQEDTLVLTINSSNTSPSGLFTLDITDSWTNEPDRAQVHVTCSGNHLTTTPIVTPTPSATVAANIDMAANETTTTTTERYTLDDSDMSRTANIAGAAGGGSVALLILVVGVTMWRRQRPRGGPQDHELGRRSNRSSKQNSSSRRTASEPSHTSGNGRGEATTHAKRGHSSVENSIEDTDPFIPRFSLEESSFEVKDNSLLARYTAGGIPTAQTRDGSPGRDVNEVEGKPLQVTAEVESPPRGQRHRGVSPVRLSIDDVSVDDTSFDQSHYASPHAGKNPVKSGSVSSDSGIDSNSTTGHRHKLGKPHREHRNPDAVHSVV